MGLRPDGAMITDDEYRDGIPGRTDLIAEYPWTRKQVVRTFAFWSLAIASGLIYFAFGTINIFRIPFFSEQGVNPQIVAWALSAEAVIATLSSFPTGWAMDRFKPRFVFATVIVIEILSFIVTMNVTEAWHVFLATTIFGAMAAGFVVTQNALWPNYFGGKYIGSIRGLAALFTMILGALGGPITGAIKDTTGTYKPAWLISTVLLVLATVLILFTPKPVPPKNAS
jgi:MFS family permease